MKAWFYIIGVCVLFLSNSLLAHQYIITTEIQTDHEQGNLTYQLDRPLKISDFKGKPVKNSPAVALVYSGVSMSMESSTHENATHIKIIIRAYMDPRVSWMKNNGKNQKVLSHEQLHFDLTALAACDLKRKIDNTKFDQHWKKQLHQIYFEEIESKLQRLQNKYDEDTVHGTIESAQESYYQFIKGQIDKSDCF